ncbi:MULTISPECIES: MFS transporter [Silvimonas]|uniref:MFS transporter n=1 Tax=Silvimonas TaxID=300264 RepID=UPI0024B32C2A|nr:MULTISPECIES: MFS transporter [Silvimonas]MDR3426566.1 MFS transporter [Silvimonas sp.]
MSSDSSSTQLPDTAAEAGVTRRVVSIVMFTFIAYLTIGIPLAVLPSYVHLDLGFGSVLAGLVISAQYLATLASRPQAGRMSDNLGAKRTVLYGLAAAGVSGVFMLLAALTSHMPGVSFALLLVGRLILGFAESCCGTGAITWGIGTVGAQHTAKVISWNGVATYGALAVGAPLGVMLTHQFGFAVIGIVVMLLGVLGVALALPRTASPIVHGERLPFRSVLGKVFAYGTGLALGSAGFGTIATFVTLFYASRHWPNAAFTLSMFGLCFVATRLIFARSINSYGGFKVAIVSFVVECIGLTLLWTALTPTMALVGAALTGIGFSLVFPALGVEAVALVPAASRGAALGAYSVFLDVALGLIGPVAGLIIGGYGYPAIFFVAAIAAAAGVVLTVVLHHKNPRGPQAIAAA